ncbi:MAG: hypothetical protein UW99_C0036G0015, partial [Candidatus Collierbacteria bacterium GW2011_GWC2_45_15]
MRFKLLALLLSVMVLVPVVVWAQDDCGNDTACLEKQINELKQSLDMSRAATKPLETEIQRLSSRIASIQKQIDRGVQNMKILEEDVKDRSGKVSASYTVM